MDRTKNDTKATIYEITIGNFLGRIKIDYENKLMQIKGLDYIKLIKRIKYMYEYRAISNLFEEKYTAWSQLMWEKEKIEKEERKISYLETPLFFSLEMFNLFKDLAEFYQLPYYTKVSKEIWNHTWISNFQKKQKKIETDLSNLKNIEYQLKDYQKEFVENYENNKYIYDLEGSILSFDQGLGKTLTATSLAECLNKEQIVIVCPNSLKENWSYEIKSYFKKYRDNEKLWLNEVYVWGISKYHYSNHTTKYIIVNMESIPKIYNLVNKRKNNMIIVDESHNFRNSNGKRTNELLKLKELMDCKDNLLMSGTPIKEAPDELVPALRMIDPYFTEELGIKYTKTFHTNKVAVANLVRTRFSRAIWRKTKNEVLNLPKKTIESIRLPVKDSNKYLIDVIEEEINTRYHEIYEEKLKENTTLKNKFVDYIWKYSSASKIDTANYIKYITESTNTGNKVDIHSHRRMIYSSFLEDNVYPNIKNERELKELKDIKMKYINMMSISISTAIGEILPPLRTQCYIDLYEENKNYFIKRIKDNIKKTVIFTPFLEVAKHLYEDLNKNKIGCELVIGETKDRMDHINNFKNEDTIDVLIATIQTLSTGVTLTEANQMFFFGLAWRNADNQQCQDRIHRIGQTNEVFIYNVFLLTPEKNLTDRIEEADTRSNEVFNAIINDNDNKLTDINNEDGDPFGNIYYPTNLMPEDKDLFDDIEDDNMGDILNNFLLEF